MLGLTKELSFCAAHRLIGYTGQCSKLHGHNYGVSVSILFDEVPSLNNARVNGMCLDFKELKEVVSNVIDCMDHTILVYCKDAELLSVAETLGQSVYLMQGNTTAENIAEHIMLSIKEEILKRIAESGILHSSGRVMVSVRETATSVAMTSGAFGPTYPVEEESANA